MPMGWHFGYDFHGRSYARSHLVLVPDLPSIKSTSELTSSFSTDPRLCLGGDMMEASREAHQGKMGHRCG